MTLYKYMKKCHKCKVEKLLEDFPANASKRDGHSETCLECKRAYNREHYKQNKKYYIDKEKKRRVDLTDWFIEFKNTLRCEKCGETHPALLDFHHKDSSKKETTLSQAVNRKWKKDRILEEVGKCTILCCRCHRLLHYETNTGPWKYRV